MNQAHDWRPIDTAPHDQRVLVWTGRNTYCAHWVQHPVTGDEAWCLAEYGDDGDQLLARPTHWQALPDSPTPPEKSPHDGHKTENSSLESLAARLRSHADAHEYIASADDEQDQWMRDLRAASLIVEKMAHAHAKTDSENNEERHLFRGFCPDETQPDAMDPECPACIALCVTKIRA